MHQRKKLPNIIGAHGEWAYPKYLLFVGIENTPVFHWSRVSATCSIYTKAVHERTILRRSRFCIHFGNAFIEACCSYTISCYGRFPIGKSFVLSTFKTKNLDLTFLPVRINPGMMPFPNHVEFLLSCQNMGAELNFFPNLTQRTVPTIFVRSCL